MCVHVLACVPAYVCSKDLAGGWIKDRSTYLGAVWPQANVLRGWMGATCGINQQPVLFFLFLFYSRDSINQKIMTLVDFIAIETKWI